MFINLNLIVTSFCVAGNLGRGDRLSDVVETELLCAPSLDLGAVLMVAFVHTL